MIQERRYVCAYACVCACVCTAHLLVHSSARKVYHAIICSHTNTHFLCPTETQAGHTNAHTCAHTRAHTHTGLQTHTHKHTHTHTHTSLKPKSTSKERNKTIHSNNSECSQKKYDYCIVFPVCICTYNVSEFHDFLNVSDSVVGHNIQEILLTCSLRHAEWFNNEFCVIEMGSNPGTAASATKQTLIHKRWVPHPSSLLYTHTHTRTHTNTHSPLVSVYLSLLTNLLFVEFHLPSLCVPCNWTNKVPRVHMLFETSMILCSCPYFCRYFLLSLLTLHWILGVCLTESMEVFGTFRTVSFVCPLQTASSNKCERSHWILFFKLKSFPWGVKVRPGIYGSEWLCTNSGYVIQNKVWKWVYLVYASSGSMKLFECGGVRHNYCIFV